MSIRIVVIMMGTVISFSNAHSTNHYSSRDSFTFAIDFVEPIALYVPDITLNDVVGGDRIRKRVPITTSKDSDRSASCAITQLVLSSPGENDITSIRARLRRNCRYLILRGILPVDIANGKTYSGNVNITYAYDLEVYQ